MEDYGRRDAAESLAREEKWTDMSAVFFIMCPPTVWKLDSWQLQPYCVVVTDIRRWQLVEDHA